MSLKTAFDIDGDRISARVIDTAGPRYLLAVALALGVTAIVVGVVWQFGVLDRAIGAWLTYGSAALAVLSLVLASALWPRHALSIDRSGAVAWLDRDDGQAEQIPMRTIRFEIREVRPYLGMGRGHALIARVPKGPELQLLLSVERERVQMLYQELGEWLARKPKAERQKQSSRTEPQDSV